MHSLTTDAQPQISQRQGLGDQVKKFFPRARSILNNVLY